MKGLCERHTIPAPDGGGGELVQNIKYDSEIWSTVLLFIPHFLYQSLIFYIKKSIFLYQKYF